MAGTKLPRAAEPPNYLAVQEKSCGLDSQLAALEAQLCEMELAKSTLEARSNLLEKFVEMRGGRDSTMVSSQPESWWLDSEAKKRIEATLGLHGTLTFSVRGEDAPLLMNQDEVSCFNLLEAPQFALQLLHRLPLLMLLRHNCSTPVNLFHLA